MLTIRTAGLLLLHPRVRGLGHVERREQVQLDDLPHEPGRDRGRVGGRCAAGVVDQHVEPAVPLHRLIDGQPRLLRVAHVGGDEAQPFGQRQRLVPAAHHHDRARGGERPRDAEADAARPAGDERDPPAEKIDLVVHS